MSLLNKLSDVSNAGIGVFWSAPHLLMATGYAPVDSALDRLFQGLVGIALMFLVKLVARYFERKKEVTAPAPVPIEPPSKIFINSKSQTDGSTEKNSEEKVSESQKADN